MLNAILEISRIVIIVFFWCLNCRSECDNVRFGIEAGDYDIRNRILDKNLKDEKIYEVADLLHKHKISFITFNLFASPEETYEQAWETIRINQRVKLAGLTAYIVLWFSLLR